MNYEELYQSIQPLERKVGDKLASAARVFRNLRRDSREGDLKNFAKGLQTLDANIKEQAALLAELKSHADAFDTRAYMEGEDFTGQLEYALKELSVDIKGTYPSFEVFPYKLRIDADNGDVYIDKKRVQCVRPPALAQRIKTGKDKLYRAGFNADVFIGELCAAYDYAMAVKNKGKQNTREDADLYLKDLYEFLIPMHRFRRDYDMQAYAFDLSRLSITKAADTKDGRKLSFGTSRKAGKMIRILDENGNEDFITTIRFYKEEEGAVIDQ